MRKALIGIILAATVLTPVAANAQRGHRGERSWSSSNNGESNRSERAQARQEAREARQSQSQPQQQVQQPQPQPQVARSGGGDGQRRSWNGGGNGDGQRGSWNRGGNEAGNRGSRAGGGGDRGGRRGGGDQTSVYPQAWQGNPNDPRLQNYRNLERRNQAGGDYRRGDRDGRNDRNWRDRDGRNDHNWRGDRDGRRNWRDSWNRGWRNDNRYNWSFWRTRNRHIFNLSPYYSPYRNWSYRRFSIGLFLDSLFYNQRYWIGDPYQYRLPAAPYGTQWVRYYNDVILVDIYTGEVIDVIYFFW
jgi:Ni/Co efflux regulator RcnB